MVTSANVRNFQHAGPYFDPPIFAKSFVFHPKFYWKSLQNAFASRRSSLLQMFIKIGVSIIGVFWKFRIILFSKVALMSKKILKRRRFPVNTAKFLRTAFSIEHLRWLLLIPPFCSAPKDIAEYP